MTKVYLASPFFNPEQLEVVKLVESLLKNLGFQLYSPRLDGVIQDMSNEERQRSLKKIFDLNCKNMDEAELILAILNWRDAGVVFELGYGYAKGKTIIVFTSNDAPVNVMLKESASVSVMSFQALEAALNEFQSGSPFTVQADERKVY